MVIGNGMEGEPASGKDAVLLARVPHLVLDGLSLAAQAVGAREAVIAVHRDSPVAPALERALAERHARGVDPVRLSLATPPARYVASEESALAHWVGDGVALPRFGARPFEKGVGGRPTLVQNAETLAHLALIARHGAAWFRAVGDEQAPGTTLVTVSGAVRSPGVVEVATGTPVAALLERCGGVTETPVAYLTGGYGGAWIPADDPALPWAPEPVRDAGGVVGAGILVALPASTCGLVETARVVRWMAGESAGQCGPCRFGLPALADDLELLVRGTATADDVRRLRTRLGVVRGRGACKHPDGVVRLVATALDVFDADVDPSPARAVLRCRPQRRAAGTGGQGHSGRQAREGVAMTAARVIVAELVVDPVRCNGYGVCAELLPELISLDEWGYPIVHEHGVDDDVLAHARRAVAACPKLALSLRPMP